MEWDLEWGGSQNIPAVRRNHPAPPLPSYVIPYLTALNDLSGSRMNQQNVVNAIPFDAKMNYALALGIEEVEAFIDTFTEIDMVYVEKQNLKIKKMVEQNGRN